MSSVSGAPEGPRHAITDLFDEERGTFLIPYPVWLVLALSLTGVVAFAVTGFLGYQDAQEPRFSRVVFAQAWPLFLWFCALLVTLQVSIFRHVSLRRRLLATLVVSAAAIVVIGITYFSKSLPAIIQQLLHHHYLIALVASSPATYSIINFGLLAIFWVDTLRRWLRRARGLPPAPRVDIGIEQANRKPQDLPSMQELVSGDLIAGAVLALVLAGLLWVGLLPNLIHFQDANGVTQSITGCTLSWPFGHCAGAGGTIADVPTLTFLDLLQALIYLPIGLLILALAATLSGFNAVEGVSDRLPPEMQPQRELVARAGSTAPIAEDVAVTVINTLRSALDRRLRQLAGNLALSLRNVAWPGLVFLAVYGVAELATKVQLYLHSPKGFSDVTADVLPALAWGVISILSAVFSAALMLFRWRVASNAMRFLRLIGFIVLLTFWIFSLALSGFNELLRLVRATDRSPFLPPSFMTALSFGALLLFGVYFLVSQARRKDTPRQPVGVGAGARAHEPAPIGAEAKTQTRAQLRD